MTPNILQVVAGILQVPSGKVLIGKRRSKDSNPGRWEFPGGKIDPGESSEAALEREIREELGLQISEFSLFDEVFFQYPQYSVAIQFFLIPVTEGIQPLCLSHDELRWIDPREYREIDFLEANRIVLEKLVERKT